VKKTYNIDYKDVHTMYYGQGLTYKEIGDKYGCSSGVIRKIAKRHGFTSLRGKSKLRKIIVQKSKLPLTLMDKKQIINGLSNKSLEIILGALLGDAYLKIRYNKNNDAYNVYFAQCRAQNKYLKWKHNLFNPQEVNNVRVEPRSSTIIKGKKYDVQDLFVFSTKPFDMSYISNMLIENGRKRINIEYLKLLTPLSLAIWHQDDGNYNVQNRIVRLATMCFTQNENKILQNYFYEYLKMPCFLEKTNCGHNYSLCLTQNSSKKFLQLIYPYMCDSMMYKNPIFKNPSETSKALKKCE